MNRTIERIRERLVELDEAMSRRFPLWANISDTVKMVICIYALVVGVLLVSAVAECVEGFHLILTDRDEMKLFITEIASLAIIVEGLLLMWREVQRRDFRRVVSFMAWTCLLLSLVMPYAYPEMTEEVHILRVIAVVFGGLLIVDGEIRRHGVIITAILLVALLLLMKLVATEMGVEVAYIDSALKGVLEVPRIIAEELAPLVRELLP